MACNEPEALPAQSAENDALEAAAFRKLLAHLRQRSDVQNIDLMILAGFCRNCLADWYQEAAADSGAAISKEQAREHVYGMPMAEWKSRHQVPATPEQMARFEAAMRAHPKG
jgi:hypothetical protein